MKKFLKNNLCNYQKDYKSVKLPDRKILQP